MRDSRRVALNAGQRAGEVPGTALRGVRVLTNVFAWLATVGLLVQLLAAENSSTPHFLLAGLSTFVLCCWWLRPCYDGWLLVVVEGIAAAGAALLLPTPQPVIGFLFAVTTKRALRGGVAKFPPKELVVVACYLSGAYFSVSRASHLEVDTVVSTFLPLFGVVIGSFALYETVRASQLAKNAHRTISALVQASPIGLALLDSDGTPTLYNDRARTMFGWDSDEAHERRVPCRHHPDITRCTASCRITGQDPVEVTIRDGGVLAVHSVPIEHPSGPGQVVIAAVDVTGRRRLEDSLRELAEKDGLTRLASRTHFLRLVTSALAEGPVGLLLIDLDRFKEINDADGHEAGDNYLRTAARCITTAFEPPVVAARIGGDEFAVLAPGHDSLSAGRLATRVLAELAAASEPIQASIGITVSSQNIATAELLRNADTAMYAAKQAGGGRVRLFRPTMAERVLARQRDKADLRTAVEQGQFVVQYQPIVDLSTSEVTSAEALVRWQRPGQGLVSPGQFIGMAEETGLIVHMGEQVLETACLQAVDWLRTGRSLGVTVNVSTRQLSAPSFFPSLNRILGITGLPAEHLTIEVTESVWADDTAVRSLMTIRDHGVRVALDDFGTGYSSLSYLQRYQFDVVKIDGSFTRALHDGGRTPSVVRCVIELAQALGAQTVAEGIETTEQADWLRQAGCTFAQGYLFGRPGNAEQLVDRSARIESAKRSANH